MMIQPVKFGFNAETAVNNHFQVPSIHQKEVQEKALEEFNGMVALLQKNGVYVLVITDTFSPHTPDSIFPNNWLSFHEDGTLVLYPMFAVNRRQERKQQVLDAINQRYEVKKVIDLTGYEKEHLFLEGTGSMVLDRVHKIAYACISPRTDLKILDAFCTQMHYTAISFTASDEQGAPIYHTNVMLCVADAYVVICLDSIKEVVEKQKLVEVFIATGKEIIEIDLEQLHHFAGNMLQVHNQQGEKLLVMSSQAYLSLHEKQITQIAKFNRILHAPIPTIEQNGGGSARCMLAEIFLPKRN
jgi:hypothetical protein